METQFIKLNMTPTGINPCFHVSQYDIGRSLGFMIYNGSEVVDLDSYTCTIEATRSDGVAITASVATDDNIGTFETTATMANKADKYKAQFVIVDGDSNRIASLPFDMDVVKAAMDENSESIEEDASLYQQYTEAVQGAIAETNAGIQAEENARIAAINAEAITRANADTTLQNNIDAEATARANAITAEATARQTADNTLQGNINSEAATRASADSNLQSQINQIVAPSGEAPSAAEVQNARIGADGVTYDTLGNAIREQVSDLKSALRHTSAVLKISKKYLGHAAISSSGVIETTSNDFKLVCFQVVPMSVISITNSDSEMTYGFFTQEPVIGSTSYNNSRTIAGGTANNILVPNNCTWITVRTTLNGDVNISPVKSSVLDKRLDINTFKTYLDSKPTKNLFDKDKISHTIIDGSGIETESAEYYTSDYILCGKGNKLTISAKSNELTSYSYRIAIYDSNKNWLRRDLATSDEYTISNISNWYIRITFEVARDFDINSIQVECSSEATSYVPHKTAFDYNLRQKVKYISPHDFGAVGDGVIDDTNAIQQMFNYIAQIADDSIIVCQGNNGDTYYVNTLTINTQASNHLHNITVENFNFSFHNNVSFQGVGNNHLGFHFRSCIFTGFSKSESKFANDYLFTLSSFENCTFSNYKNIIYASVFEQLLYFNDCTFYDCETCFYGTAFFTLIVSNSIFQDCKAVLEQRCLNQSTDPNNRVASNVIFNNNSINRYGEFVFKICAYDNVKFENNYIEGGGVSGGEVAVTNRHGVVLYENEDYTVGKKSLIVAGNHFQETIDNNHSPRLVQAPSTEFDCITITNNYSYNTRFLDIDNVTCRGHIIFYGNTLKTGSYLGNILGDFSEIKLSGYVDGKLYINGQEY